MLASFISSAIAAGFTVISIQAGTKPLLIAFWPINKPPRMIIIFCI